MDDIRQVPQTNIDLSQTNPVRCDNCQNETFVPTLLMRRVSALVSPNGREGLAPIQVFSCNACGHVNTEFVPAALLKGGQTISEQKTDDNIISSELKVPKPKKHSLKVEK